MSPLVSPCAHCGKKSGKPKFCSQSCAAKSNNARAPKRKPEGRCPDCGVAIRTKQRRCETCAARAAEAARRIAANIQTFRTPAGEVRELPIPRASVTATMVFEPHSPAGRPFTLEDPCGPFLDALLAVVFARPAYIRPDDVHRYAAWIDAFRGHLAEQESETPRGERRLRMLGYALRNWVNAELRADRPALFPTFAADAAEFIAAHAFGHYGFGGGAGWRIVGMVGTDRDDSWAARSQVDDAALKRAISMQHGGLVTRCVLPAGCVLPNPASDGSLVEPGEPFVFAVDRCHLTQSTCADGPCQRATEADPPQFDIAADLWFRGIVPVNRDGRPLTEGCGEEYQQWRHRPGSVSVEIPVRWIAEVYEPTDDRRGYRAVPVPRWCE